MFVGHYGVAFAAKPAASRVPLWVWFVAVQWLDVVWSVLVLAGIEKVRIVPGFTEANALDLYYMPYTHSLVGALSLSAVFGAIVAALVKGQRGRTLLLVAAAAFSHWILDFLVHTPDLALYDDTGKVGLGLWRHIAISFPLEIAVLLAGIAIYARALAPQGWVRVKLWAFVAVLIAFQVYANFGPPPESDRVMAIMAFSFYLVLAAAAAWVERGAARA